MEWWRWSSKSKLVGYWFLPWLKWKATAGFWANTCHDLIHTWKILVIAALKSLVGRGVKRPLEGNDPSGMAAWSAGFGGYQSSNLLTIEFVRARNTLRITIRFWAWAICQTSDNLSSCHAIYQEFPGLWFLLKNYLYLTRVQHVWGGDWNLLLDTLSLGCPWDIQAEIWGRQ